jgi:hypothetical protein
MTDREWLESILPKAAHKKIDLIIEYYAPVDIGQVEVNGGHLVVDTVEAYGLDIGLDASGNATTVSSPYGLFIAD